MEKNSFYTFSEYMKKENNLLTASMEDYLEMIYRLCLKTGFTRIHELSSCLNVQPPSTTKMVQKLAELKFLKYEKYGVIMLREDGKRVGKLLMERHSIVENFLRIMGISKLNILEETEKIEHVISGQTIECIEEYIKFMKDNPDINEKFKEYKQCNKK